MLRTEWASLVAQVVESAFNAGDPGSIPGWGKIPWRRVWQPIPVSLSGKFHGQQRLDGYSPWVTKSQTGFND